MKDIYNNANQGKSNKTEHVSNLTQKFKKKNQIEKSHDSIDDENQLYFAIRLKGYEKPLQLTLTFQGYKQQFRDFVHKYKLTRDESLALKQIVKARLAELLEKEKVKNDENQTFNDKRDNYLHKHISKISESECQESIVNQDLTLNEESNCRENDPFEQPEEKYSQNDEKKLLPMHSKKRFVSEIKDSHFNHEDSLISSIQQNLCLEQDHFHESKQEVDKIHKYIQSNQHVSFNYNNRQIEDAFEERFQVDKIPKCLKVSRPKKQEAEEYMNFFLLNQKIDQKAKFFQNSENTKSKKYQIFIPIKAQTSKSPVVLKKTIPQSAKIHKQKNQSPLSNKQIAQSRKQSKSREAKNIQDHKPNNFYQSKDHEVIREIFYRLHRQETASSRQRLKRFSPPKSPQQKQSEKIVEESLFFHRNKFKSLTSEQREELFTKLYVTSTQSSMNRKLNSKASINYSNEIEHIINESTKRYNKQNQKLQSMKRKPDLQRKLYREKSKRCNAHCEKFQYEKKVLEEQQKKKRKQQQIRKQVRSRSKESLISGGSASRVKRSGLCLCCHRQKVEEEQKRKSQLIRKSRKPSYSTNTKYSLQKQLLPSNISFMSDVLEESYNELFPKDENK